ncbi:MFS transporter [Nannocystis sp.]|uniref:MFS transporter n=1 Tax=Nannocystis sp. TaxID=1962667 RepID=UPI0025DC4AD9|nr:MFS transporter [Nannocystis sp.]MBK7828881.1 MFS transporter [Nannocystis sp.]
MIQAVRDILKDPSIRVAYMMCLMLGIAYGIVMAIVAVYLNKERGIDEQTIGGLAFFFSAGIAIFAVPMGALVRVLSPRVMLAVALAGYGVATAVFPFLTTFTGLATARAIDGAFSVGAWISIETILLMRTTALNRGFVTSLYSIVLAIGYVIGSVFAAGFVYIGPSKLAFVCAGMLAVLAALLGLLRLDKHIGPVAGSDHAEHGDASTALEPEGPPIGALQLYWQIKTACLTTFTYGYFQGSLVLFLPLFLIDHRGVAEGPTKLLVAFFAAGMAVSVVIFGRIGDRHGHLKTIRALVAIGAVITVSVVYLPWFPVVAAMVFFAGAVLAPVYPLSIALQSLIAEPRDYNRSNALLNVSYALGTLAGPLLCGYLYVTYSVGPDGTKVPFGGELLFWQLAALWLLVLVATSVFRSDDPSLWRRRAKAQG